MSDAFSIATVVWLTGWILISVILLIKPRDEMIRDNRESYLALLFFMWPLYTAKLSATGCKL